jgi:DNA polymerase-3 subunit alpha
MTMEDTFVYRKRGWQEVSYVMPEVAEILKPTFGVLVYQEQIMQIAQVVCGYTGAEADILRKGVGKKIPELVKKEKAKFVGKAVEKGHDLKSVEKLWYAIETFARYGFNKSHCVGYGKLTYQTAYMKAHYTKEWMAALLTVKADNDRYVRKYVDECIRLGIPVLRPDVNRSMPGWAPETGGIRFGLRSIKGIDKAAAKLVEIRGKGFPGFKKLIDRTHANGMKMSEIETLISAGACDQWGKRLKMLEKLQERWKILDKRRKHPQKVIPLFKEKIEGLEEGVDLREEDRQSAHLELLSGCYATDDETVADSPIRLIAKAPDRLIAFQAISWAQGNSGSTPLILGFPSLKGKTIWVQAGKVRDPAKARQELEKLGCEISL